MRTRLLFDIHRQPDDSTCGPTCLQAVYRYYGDELALSKVITTVPQLEDGGTIAVFLGCHALRRGYKATIHTLNMQVFDPTWFESPETDLVAKLKAQLKVKSGRRRLRTASRGYIEFLQRGGRVLFEEFTPALIRRYLNRGTPILTGLSVTFLYRCARERGVSPTRAVFDDIGGIPVGHFVVLCGYDRETKKVLIADPLHPNPLSGEQQYEVSIDRVLNSIHLGILTYDANLLIIEPAEEESGGSHA